MTEDIKEYARQAANALAGNDMSAIDDVVTVAFQRRALNHSDSTMRVVHSFGDTRRVFVVPQREWLQLFADM